MNIKLFSEYPYLEDDLIILHRMSPEDAAALEKFTHDKRIYRYLPTFLYEQRYDDKAEVIARMDDECLMSGEGILLGIYPKADPEAFSGIAEIYGYEEARSKASVGCRLSPEYWGKGIATAAVGLLRDYLVNEVGLKTVTAHIMKENQASARTVLKNGFVLRYGDILEDWGFDELNLTDKYVFKGEWLNRGQEKHKTVRVEQFVMAYQADQDRIRAMLPEGFGSLRPVLRINSEIRDDSVLYIEFNTPVEARGKRGWLNIASWKSSSDDIIFTREKGEVIISTPFLDLRYKGTGIPGGCPAEKDNDGCFFIGSGTEFRPAEVISENKEFCDCSFRWKFNEGDAHGVSEGKTLPAFMEEKTADYEPLPFSPESAAAIPCIRVLGSYIVRFDRNR